MTTDNDQFDFPISDLLIHNIQFWQFIIDKTGQLGLIVGLFDQSRSRNQAGNSNDY